eukprot:COSAG01_NODE_48962_length_376_cov_1.014440_1_plen_101_part_01
MIDTRRSGGQGWKLGKLASMANPGAIMHEIYRALAAVGFEWKTISAYNLKCRYQEEPLGSPGAAAAAAAAAAGGGGGDFGGGAAVSAGAAPGAGDDRCLKV